MNTTTSPQANKVEEVLADQFTQAVEEAEGKVLVDFYAPWCGPCKMIAPLVEQIAQDHQELKVVKVNADTSQSVMAKFGIRGIPTLLLINNGQLVATQVGATSMSQMKEFINQT
jgi:thioredoxin 1